MFAKKLVSKIMRIPAPARARVPAFSGYTSDFADDGSIGTGDVVEYFGQFGEIAIDQENSTCTFWVQVEGETVRVLLDLNHAHQHMVVLVRKI